MHERIEEVTKPSGQKTRLFIFSEDEKNIQTLEKALAADFRVTGATTIGKAKDVLNGPFRPNLALLDVVTKNDFCLHSKDGLALLKHIQEHNKDIKTVVLFDHAANNWIDQSETDRIAIDLPVIVDIIAKPIDNAELKRILLQTQQTNKSVLSKGWLKLSRIVAFPVLVFIVFISGWEAVCSLFDIKEYLLPAPSLITSIIVRDRLAFIEDAAVTMTEAFLGFLLANVLSLFVAIGFSHSDYFERSFYPYVIALKSIPIIAIAPLLVIWFGYGFAGKVIMAGIISFFPLVVNATVGLKNVDSNALDLMHSLSASQWQVLTKLRFPNALPYIFSALKISSALSVMGAIVAEMTGANTGLGYTIMLASYNIDTPKLFAAVVIASMCGIGFFGVIMLLEYTAAKKYNFSPKKDST